MEKIKVAICDDLAELCEYYREVIEAQEDMEFAGSATNSSDCQKLVEETHPDILLLDIQIETNDSGINLIPIIKQISAETKIITITIHEDDEYIFNALAEGAEDYLLKTYPDEQILEAIRNIHNDNHTLRPEIVKKVLKVCNIFKHQQNSLLYIVNTFTRLSPTELEILHDAYDGLSYKNIAKKRFVEEITVRAHISRILKKFEYPNMKALLADLRELRVFDLFKN